MTSRGNRDLVTCMCAHPNAVAWPTPSAAHFGELEKGPWRWGVRFRGASLARHWGQPTVAISLIDLPQSNDRRSASRPSQPARRDRSLRTSRVEVMLLTYRGRRSHLVCLTGADRCARPSHLTAKSAGQWFSGTTHQPNGMARDLGKPQVTSHSSFALPGPLRSVS